MPTKAPIDGLPSEILAEIFIYHVNEGSPVKPLLLVSRWWRQVAITTSPLWNCIKLKQIATNDLRTVNSHCLGTINDALFKTCTTPQQMAKLLGLSGALPLHIFVDKYYKDYTLDHNEDATWVEILLRDAARWRSLRFQMGNFSYQIIRALDEHSVHLGTLETLIIYCKGDLIDWKSRLLRLNELSKNLHQLHLINNMDWKYGFLQPRVDFIPAELAQKLTSLELDGWFQFPVPVLGFCQQLSYLRLRRANLMPVDKAKRKLLFPFLRYLELQDLRAGPGIQLLQMPALEELQITNCPNVEFITDAESLQTLTSTGRFNLTSFQGFRSPTLTTLEFTTTANDDTIIRVLNLKEYTEDLILNFFHKSGKPGGGLFLEMSQNTSLKKRDRMLCPRLVRLVVTFRFTMTGKSRMKARGWFLRLIAARKTTNCPIQSLKYACPCDDGGGFEEMVV